MTEQTLAPEQSPKTQELELQLPFGLIGFPDFNKVETVASKEEYPFLRLRETHEEGLEFVVLQPYGHFPNYSVQISQEDLDSLNIQDASDVHLLNIVTTSEQGRVSINLIAPIVFNKATGKGKQLIIENHNEFSPEHVLYDPAQTDSQ